MTDDTRTEEEVEESTLEETEGEPVGEPEGVEERGATAAELRLQRAGQETEDVFPIHGRAVIGRFDPTVGPIDVDLSPLPEAVYISRKHAVIEFADGAWTISDLGSSNGTFVLVPGEDFQRISESTVLEDGAQIALGNARFVFRVADSAGNEEESDE